MSEGGSSNDHDDIVFYFFLFKFMSKLASNTIITVSFSPKSIAFSFFKMLIDGQSDKFILTVCKSTLVSIVAIT